MKKFEYRYIVLSNSDTFDNEALNNLGESGWELTSTFRNENNVLLGILKREKDLVKSEENPILEEVMKNKWGKLVLIESDDVCYKCKYSGESMNLPTNPCGTIECAAEIATDHQYK